MPTAVPLQIIHNQPSFILETPDVHLAMTRLGGHMAPVEFLRQSGRPFQPYHIAPWADMGCGPENPRVIQVLRGDFFCCPFGSNDEPYEGEEHPLHGEPANRPWKLKAWEGGAAGTWMRLDMDLTIRKGRIEKTLALAAGENVVYSSHVISGMSGMMNFGHHATLSFPDEEGSGRLSFSPHRLARTYTHPTEKPEEKGYSILKPDALIDDLTRAPQINGVTTDLTRYPARRGFEDVAIICPDPDLAFGWTAVAFESLGAVWFSLRDPKILPSTMLWMSNQGRHYEPWSGRNINCMGLEDILGSFHEGVAASARNNDLAARGIPTSRRMEPGQPLAVNYIQGAAAIPQGFGRVASIERISDKAIRIMGEGGPSVEAPCRVDFLKTGDLATLGL